MLGPRVSLLLISFQLNQHKPRGREFYDGTFINDTIIGACENGLGKKEVVNLTIFFLSLALWLKTCGTIHTKGMTSQMEKSGLVIQLNQRSAIPRQIDYVNERTNLKGKVRVYYSVSAVNVKQYLKESFPKEEQRKNVRKTKNWTVS